VIHKINIYMHVLASRMWEGPSTMYNVLVLSLAFSSMPLLTSDLLCHTGVIYSLIEL